MPETLRQKQTRFVWMTAALIIHARTVGYELTEANTKLEDYAKHKPNGKHPLALAKDWNLFVDGKWMSTTEAHKPLGEYWESIGGTWGGRRADGNHYEL